MVKGRHSSFHKKLLSLLSSILWIHTFSSSYSRVSVVSYSYNLGDFVKDFYESSMILISYELELNHGIKSDPTDQRKC